MAATNGGNPAKYFGKQMRKEREAKGWTLREFATRAEINYTTASLIENGKRPPNARVAAACDRVFPDRHGWFSDYYRELQDWSEVPPGFRDWQEHEDKTSTLRDWSPSVLTGLLQTSDYAHDLLSTYPDAAAKQLAARLAGRMERQRRVLLRQDAPAAWFIVDQLALYRQVGSAQTMAAQLGHLVEVAARPNVTVQVLPARAHPANASGFVVADDAVLCEHVRGSFVYVDGPSLSALDRLFATLLSECWPVSESLAHFREVSEIWAAHGASLATPTPTGATA